MIIVFLIINFLQLLKAVSVPSSLQKQIISEMYTK